ncbi:MAG: 2-oxoglutarate dehydrogenase complex dihydrolipoyllysine-residue succinyltransferase [Acetobacteraceae bacterium]|nr:2-oxoglutarate dehydrogenase complex dihydrolipoyllysine-residue succinyltransferase [Acetobacteraceae bacterium]
MMAEIKVPALGESITSATVARWLKHPGDYVERDEPVVELETEKVTVEANAPASGVLAEIRAAEGSEVAVGAVLAVIDTEARAAAIPQPAPAAHPAAGVTAPPRPSGPVARPATPLADRAPRAESAPSQAHPPMPSAAKLLAEHGISPAAVGEGSGKDGRLTKADVLEFLKTVPPKTPMPAAEVQPAPAPEIAKAPPAGRERPAEPREERVRMTRLRRTIAARLKEAQNTAAMLTTFNEADMSAVIALRNQYREIFEKKYHVRLGFMSFFVKACIIALKEFPAVNAEIDGEDIVYKNYVHMGIAVGGPSGLVVPVIRDADRMSFAEIERAIEDFGSRARSGTLKLEELTGGTFTITNGGIYGSLLSTPILNPPQSGILGMHRIQERPVAVAGKIEIRPMMYLALSYDHRIVDGREAVSFLVRVKENIEDPHRILLDI